MSGKRDEGPFHLPTHLLVDGELAARRSRKILAKFRFLARVPQVVQGRIGGDAAGPGTKISRGVEPLASAINAPKRLHGQILGGTGVANDADDPGVDFLLVLPKESLKSFEVARRESFE